MEPTGSTTTGRFALRYTRRPRGDEHQFEPVTETRGGLSVAESAALLDDHYQRAHAGGELRHVFRTWGLLQLYFADTFESYEVRLDDCGDLQVSAAMLACAGLHRQWPHAAFGVRPVGKRWLVDWIDGPTAVDVRIFHDQGYTQYYVPRAKHLVLHRHYSPAAWAHTAREIETALAAPVPLTAHRGLDWPAATRTPVTVGRDDDLPPDADTAIAAVLRTTPTLADGLRAVAEISDFTHLQAPDGIPV